MKTLTKAHTLKKKLTLVVNFSEDVNVVSRKKCLWKNKKKNSIKILIIFAYAFWLVQNSSFV